MSTSGPLSRWFRAAAMVVPRSQRSWQRRRTLSVAQGGVGVPAMPAMEQASLLSKLPSRIPRCDPETDTRLSH